MPGGLAVPWAQRAGVAAQGALALIQGTLSVPQLPETSPSPPRRPYFRRRCSHNRRLDRCAHCAAAARSVPGAKRVRRPAPPKFVTCEHGRMWKRCWCSSSEYCRHFRRIAVCHECGGAALCVHKRYQPHCKDCVGAYICAHGRIMFWCKLCGGASICACKLCGGFGVCVHNRQRTVCKTCCGASICHHGRALRICRDCSGNALCRHNKLQYWCRDCGGNGICRHGRSRYKCKFCVSSVKKRVRHFGEAIVPCE